MSNSNMKKNNYEQVRDNIKSVKNINDLIL